MKLLCTECKKFYSADDYIVWVLGIIALVCLIFTPFGLIAVIGIGIAIYFILKEERHCTECEGKTKLLKLDTTEAIEFIKKHDLSIPEESLRKKYPWEKN